MISSLITNIEKLNIILASTSPRRYEILKKLGLDFKVVPSHVDEDEPSNKNPIDYVKKFARAKGLAVAEQNPNSLIISADTVVSIDEKILGKPQNEDDAFQMLLYLNGRTHQVYTGYGLFLRYYDKEFINVAATDVTFRKLSEEDIWSYINTGEPFDKAGGYGIQGLGSLFVEGINGCFFNVVGFPVSQFYVDLERFLRNIVL